MSFNFREDASRLAHSFCTFFANTHNQPSMQIRAFDILNRPNSRSLTTRRSLADHSSTSHSPTHSRMIRHRTPLQSCARALRVQTLRRLRHECCCRGSVVSTPYSPRGFFELTVGDIGRHSRTWLRVHRTRHDKRIRDGLSVVIQKAIGF